ncbi:unnamed protein product [Lactuca saligna]|uniref:dihydrolipoyllysine-residue succinyltransferase n=1 Tax=Lactuca saligna TaxID=75948 RepID=A0AA36E7D0_LACSI|nr:unnamed protein product [Lactuca saligna]
MLTRSFSSDSEPRDHVEVDYMSQLTKSKLIRQVTIDVGSPEAGVIKEFVAKEGDIVEPPTKVVMSKRLMKSIYLMKLRSEYEEAFLEKHGVKFGLMSGFVKTAVSGLQNQLIINVVIDGDDIIYRDYIDISIAVGTPTEIWKQWSLSSLWFGEFGTFEFSIHTYYRWRFATLGSETDICINFTTPLGL